MFQSRPAWLARPCTKSSSSSLKLQGQSAYSRSTPIILFCTRTGTKRMEILPSPFPEDTASADPRGSVPELVWKWVAVIILGCLHVVVQRKVTLELCFEYPQIPISLDTTEILLCGQQCRGHPAQHHTTVSPATHSACPHADPRVRILNEIGRRQAAAKRWGKLQLLLEP